MAKTLFDRVAIVGVGLIGGSIGLAVKKRKLARFVAGVVRRASSAKEALSAGALDMATLDLVEGVRGADLVILCAPVDTIVSQMKRIAPQLKRGAVVIDVGSSKVEIVREAKKYFRTTGAYPGPGKSPARPSFVGCHPMAGSEKTGVKWADADLFEGQACFVTSPHARIERFWKELGALPFKVTPRLHDALVAKMSHLPHASAFALFYTKKNLPGKTMPLNPSLRSCARLAKSDDKIWTQIFLSNRKPVLWMIRDMERSLSKLRSLIARKDDRAIAAYIRRANAHAGRVS